MMVSRYGNIERFLTTFNPELQRRICGNVEECYFGDYPTLSTLKAGYGQNAATAWIIPQLYNLSEYCGCKEKLQGTPLEDCASVIATDFYYLKVSELMLFFHRFKSGLYGRFYGSIDPLIITTSLRAFLKERMYAYDKREQEERERKRAEDAKNHVTWEDFCKDEYDRLMAEGKTEEAKAWLDRPHPLLLKRQHPAKKEQPKENPDDVVKIARSLLSDPLADDNSKIAFSRIFKKKYGCTPQEYIDRHKKE
ncbi:MAG: hypothetical protein IJ640_09485 [Prevotella sp.]|nr:hypothetical protein [Prevotella sp.]